MFTHQRRPFFVGMLTLLLLSLLSPTLVIADNNPPYNERYAVEFWTPNPCTAELIHFVGTTHVVIDVDEHANHQHGRWHSNVNGHGVGEVTGTEYTYNETFNQTGNVIWDELHSNYIARAHIHVISHGSAPNFIMQLEYRYVIHPNGNVDLNEDVVSSECQGG